MGEVWIDGDTIVYAGPEGKETDIVWDKEIDAKGNLIMPGFKNAHTHTAMTFLRSYADDLPLQEWLYQMCSKGGQADTEISVRWKCLVSWNI